MGVTLALRTADPTCHVWVDGRESTWEAGRSLAHGLLGYLERCLGEAGYSFTDLGGLIVFRGPGSFTGLRIGITVMNTIAQAQGIPIAGGVGGDWRETCLADLRAGKNDRIVLPLYGSDAHITPPRK